MKKDLPDNLPKTIKQEITMDLKTLTMWFHDQSRIVVELNSGNPLASRSLSQRKNENNSHAARYLKNVKLMEMYNGSLYINLANKTVIECKLHEIPIDRKLAISILEQINKESSQHPNKECQIYVGELFPPHYPLSIPKITYKITQPLLDQSEFIATLDLEIKNNKFLAVMRANKHPLSIEYRISIVNEMVQNNIDIASFVAGRFYTATVSYVLNTKNELVFEHQKLDLSQIDAAQWDDEFNYILTHLQGDKGWYVTYAIRDWKLAAQFPLNTGFYCRRALESLTHHIIYVENNINAKDKLKRWEAVKNIINMDDNVFIEIKNYGGDERHGEIKGILSETRQRFLTETRSAIAKYINWFSDKRCLESTST